MRAAWSVLAARRGLIDLRRYYSTSQPTPYDAKAFAYCANQVKTYDYENFVWIVQLPKDLRAALLAVRCFHIEVGLVAESAKEGGLRALRYQFWRDALNRCYQGTPPEQPALLALSQVLQRTQLTRYRLTSLVNAREEDANAVGVPATIAALEQYAEATASQLHYLQLEAASALDQEAYHTASHLGKAVGIAKLLQGTPYYAQQRRSYLPSSLCAAKRVSTEQLFRGQSSEGLQDVVLQVATTAKQHLDEACKRRSSILRPARPLMLSAVPTRLYLEALESANFDVFAPQLALLQHGRGLGYQLRLKWHMLAGTY